MLDAVYPMAVCSVALFCKIYMHYCLDPRLVKPVNPLIHSCLSGDPIRAPKEIAAQQFVFDWIFLINVTETQSII